jgi:hypothetical protein
MMAPEVHRGHHVCTVYNMNGAQAHLGLSAVSNDSTLLGKMIILPSATYENTSGDLRHCNRMLGPRPHKTEMLV